MKTLSFISGVLLSMAIVAPASAYIGVYQPRSTVRMTYTQGNGSTRLSTAAVRRAAQQPKSTIASPLSKEWPEWIGVPNWAK